MSNYRIEIERSAISERHMFRGPGLPRYACGAHFVEPAEAETILRLLHAAYEAGKKARSAEILSLLGGVSP